MMNMSSMSMNRMRSVVLSSRITRSTNRLLTTRTRTTRRTWTKTNLPSTPTHRLFVHSNSNTGNTISNTISNTIRTQTTTATTTGTTTAATKTKTKTYIIKIIKYARIPTLVMSVYSLGYTAGMADYMRSPRKFKAMLRQSILASVGLDVNDGNGNDNGNGNDINDKVFIATEGEWRKKKNYKTRRPPGVYSSASTTGASSSSGAGGTERDLNLRRHQLEAFAHVGEKILDSARRLVLYELSKLLAQYQNQTQNPDLELDLERDIDKWEKAYESLETDGDKWRFILLDVPFANAFVSETTPYTIYLTTAMLENVMSNDDELALVLGHELSHLLLAHTTNAMKREGYLRAFEVLLLTMDPTEGYMSLFIMGVLKYMREILSSSYSRNNEHEADELGIKLAAMSCYNTRNAVQVFSKLHDYDVELRKAQSNTEEIVHSTAKTVNVPATTNTKKEGYQLSSYTDTHPPTLVRYENLLRMSEEENPFKYSSVCGGTKAKFFRALKMVG